MEYVLDSIGDICSSRCHLDDNQQFDSPADMRSGDMALYYYAGLFHVAETVSLPSMKTYILNIYTRNSIVILAFCVFGCILLSVNQDFFKGAL
jgi:hypothetical protein